MYEYFINSDLRFQILTIDNQVDIPMNDLTCTRLDVHRVPDTKQKGLQKVDVVLFLDGFQQLILFLENN